MSTNTNYITLPVRARAKATATTLTVIGWILASLMFIGGTVLMVQGFEADEGGMGMLFLLIGAFYAAGTWALFTLASLAATYIHNRSNA